jgi:hypothetical protein
LFARDELAYKGKKIKVIQNNLMVKTLSYSSKINGYLYPQGVSPPLKKLHDMFLEGKPAHSVGWLFGVLQM